MGTLMFAYLAVWLAVVLYVGRLGLRQRRLQRALDELQQRNEHPASGGQPPAQKAA